MAFFKLKNIFPLKKKQKTNKTKGEEQKKKQNETKSPQKYYSIYFLLINNSWAWGLPCSMVDISIPLENWQTLHQRVSTTESFLVSSESPCLLPSQGWTLAGWDLYRSCTHCQCLEFVCAISPVVSGVIHHEGRGLVKTSHLLLSVPKSLTLCVLSSCGSLC